MKRTGNGVFEGFLDFNGGNTIRTKLGSHPDKLFSGGGKFNRSWADSFDLSYLNPSLVKITELRLVSYRRIRYHDTSSFRPIRTCQRIYAVKY